MANTAFGRGYGPHECRVVVVVGQQAQPAAQVFNLGPAKKALPARHLVRNVGFAKRLFKRFGHVIGAVQHAKVFPFPVLPARRLQRALGPQALDTRHHPAGLVIFTVAINHPHRLAFAQLAKQCFREQLGIGRNHVVGRTQDGAGRAVVLLQLHDHQIGVVNGQLFQVIQRCATPAVNGLVIVTHGRKPSFFAYQTFQHLILRGVGVLVLIDQHMA